MQHPHRKLLILPIPLAREASCIRQAQRLSLGWNAINHYIKNLHGDIGGVECRLCPDNIHTYWFYPRATQSCYHHESNLPPHFVAIAWKSWAAPPRELQSTLLRLLIDHIKTTTIESEEDDHEISCALFTHSFSVPDPYSSLQVGSATRTGDIVLK